MQTNQHAMLGRYIAMSIIESVAPYWYQDPVATIERQGNWPVDAEYGAVIRIHDRGFNNHDCGQVKFFRNKEALDEYMKEAQENYPGSEFSFSAEIYAWDLGPEHLRSVVLN